MSYISNLKLNNDIISFDLNSKSNDIKISLANAIRRTIISDIFVYTIDENNIDFFENTSMLNNEFLKHRLSLIPIISGLKDINYDDLIISCKKNNEGEYMQNIYVNDFVCKDIKNDLIIENELIFKYPNILFGKLKSNQYLSFEAKLIKNSAEHGGSSFSSVAKCIYTFKIDEEKVKKIKSEMSEKEIESFNNQDIQRNYSINKNGDPDVFQFSIESIGFYDAMNIVSYGINRLIEKLDDIKNEFRNKNSKKVLIIENIENLDFFNFLIENENETIGNLLSTYITYDKNISYCGYIIEHPLKKNILLKVKLINENDLENNILVIENNINNIIELLKNIEKELK
jgi:DNA-directed RNA polymerase subunit L